MICNMSVEVRGIAREVHRAIPDTLYYGPAHHGILSPLYAVLRERVLHIIIAAVDESWNDGLFDIEMLSTDE